MGERVENPNRPSITLSRNVLVLALDTTTRAGSISVVRDDQVLSEIIGDPSRTHGERLPGDLMRAVDAASISLPDIDLLAVAAGPGSFTGLRVGIAAMQGLAMALDRRIVPVSLLDALADVGADGHKAVATWVDAQRGEVFSALYDVTGTRVVIPPASLPPASTLDAWGDLQRPVGFLGDGAVRYADVIRARLGAETPVIAAPPVAATIGRLAARSPDRAVLPHAVVPIYIRKPDAELARDRRGRS
jgi:tRNA threonylcarbamoyladenosine biosynthesis protein TsaB